MMTRKDGKIFRPFSVNKYDKNIKYLLKNT